MLRYRYLEYLGIASLLLTGCAYPPVQEAADMQPQQPLLADLGYQYNQANTAANPPAVVVVAQSETVKEIVVETTVSETPLDPPSDIVDDSVAFADNLPLDNSVDALSFIDIPLDPPVDTVDDSIIFADNIPLDPPADLAFEPLEDNAPLAVSFGNENNIKPIEINTETTEVEVVFLDLEDMSISKSDAPAEKQMQFVKTIQKSFSSPSEAEKTDNCPNLSSAERKELESLRSMLERLM